MGKILVIDDEPGIVRFLRRALESDGHTVLVATDGAEGLRANGEHVPDLVLLDLLMPGVGGLGVLAAILAEDPGARVVVLSAMGDVDTRVRCLELGAADFLPKPFAIAELLARVRCRAREAVAAVRIPEVLRCGAVRLDLHTRRLYSDGAEIDLSRREFALVRHLMRNAGGVCSREELLSEVWGYAFDPGSNVVDVAVARLRGKIRGLRIDTIRNVGYSLRQV